MLALDAHLRAVGGGLSAEQRSALALACSDRQLVMIEGQAGTGKSTILIRVAQTHQADGRETIVTSTGALAAQRLANELMDVGVNASSYSTAALHAAIASGQLELSPKVTVIHDEAALASTREQHQLLDAIESSGARLIEVGDPHQSQAVGAGGLWPHLEAATRSNQAHVELTRNVRTQDPADRRDQQLFRAGDHERALRDYAARGRVNLVADQRPAEDAALEAAHADRQADKRTLVIAQSSNEHLDELNARAQAIRIEHGELGEHGVAVTGRPYRLHAGDQIQIRHALNHPEHGQLRNGTTGHVLRTNPNRDVIRFRLADGREAQLDREQLDRADVRLSYVQHPFPAQGQTTDTAHLIIAEHATQEGCYVALTRARQQTDIHASLGQLQLEDERDPLTALAERMSRSEPEIPSIHTPLAYERRISSEHQQTLGHDVDGNHATTNLSTAPRDADQRRGRHVIAVLGPEPHPDDSNRTTWETAADAIERYRERYNIDPAELTALGPEPPAGHFQQRHDRRLAAIQVLDVRDQLDLGGLNRRTIGERIRETPGLTRDQHTHARGNGWEP
jgi:ATP-dependent exoDNAse (exonuclease V) alpha subunit